MDILGLASRSQTVRWMISAAFALSLLGTLFAIEQTKDNTNQKRKESIAQKTSNHTNAHKVGSYQAEKAFDCANKLLSEPVAMDVLTTLKENKNSLVRLNIKQFDSVKGISTGSETLAVLRDGQCFVIVSANTMFAEVFVGPMIKMPIH